MLIDSIVDQVSKGWGQFLEDGPKKFEMGKMRTIRKKIYYAVMDIVRNGNAIEIGKQ